MLYSPFVHHFVNLTEIGNANAYICGSNCVEAAIQAIDTAKALDDSGLLLEAYPLTMDVLALAATVLLVADVETPHDDKTHAVRRASLICWALLGKASLKNIAAANCLASLMVIVAIRGVLYVPWLTHLLKPLYQSITPISPDRPIVPDFTLFSTDTCIPLQHCPLNLPEPATLGAKASLHPNPISTSASLLASLGDKNTVAINLDYFGGQ